MIQKLTKEEIDIRIHDFLSRKSYQFPELHLVNDQETTSPKQQIRGTSVWFKQVQNT